MLVIVTICILVSQSSAFSTVLTGGPPEFSERIVRAYWSIFSGFVPGCWMSLCMAPAMKVHRHVSHFLGSLSGEQRLKSHRSVACVSLFNLFIQREKKIGSLCCCATAAVHPPFVACETQRVQEPLIVEAHMLHKGSMCPALSLLSLFCLALFFFLFGKLNTEILYKSCPFNAFRVEIS